jgi:putative aminopeptidase FrvX
MRLLNELYQVNAPSGSEWPVANIVKRELDSMGIPYQEDKFGQIYNFNNNVPMICSHMDQVRVKGATHIIIEGNIIGGNGNIGADDKNGVWIVLNILKDNPFLSFVFSTCEEIGGNIGDLLDKNIKHVGSIPYCLVFDRKGSGDIIGFDNAYCNLDLEDDLSKIGKRFGYKPTVGIFSDCDAISEHIPCVNLSCGYYNAHTEKEFTVMSELRNALDFGQTIVSLLFKKYTKPDKWWGDFDDGPMDYLEPEIGYCEYCDQWINDGESTRCPFCDSLLEFQPAEWYYDEIEYNITQGEQDYDEDQYWTEDNQTDRRLVQRKFRF